MLTTSAQAHEEEELARGKRRAFWDQVFWEKEAVGFPGGRAWKKGLNEELWTTVGLWRKESHTLAPAPAPLLWFKSNK